MIRRLDHVAVAVYDLDASLPFYADRLGLELVHDELLPSVGVRLAYLQLGNTYLQLVQPIGAGAITDSLAQNGEGLHHVCFEVEKIENALAYISDERDASVFLGGRGRRACFLDARLNDVLVELTETWPVEAGPQSATV